jgi:hypothetical protein
MRLRIINYHHRRSVGEAGEAVARQDFLKGCGVSIRAPFHVPIRSVAAFNKVRGSSSSHNNRFMD